MCVCEGALRFNWHHFVLATVLVFVAQVLFFTLLNSLLALYSPVPPTFTELLLLHLGVSAGYGTGPFVVHGSLQHLLLSMEALARTIYFTLVTGILYARFSRPVPRIRFSSHAFVCRHHGQRSLVVRIANDRLESRQLHSGTLLNAHSVLVLFKIGCTRTDTAVVWIVYGSVGPC